MTVLKAKIGGTFQSVLSGYASNVYTGPNPPADPNVEFWVDTDAVLPVVPWTPMVLINGWTNFGTFFDAAYRKVGDIVEVRGVVKNTVSLTAGGSSDVSVLPVGFRPPRWSMLSSSIQIATTYLVIRVDVVADGTIRLYPSATGVPNYASLDSIRFSVTA